MYFVFGRHAQNPPKPSSFAMQRHVFASLLMMHFLRWGQFEGGGNFEFEGTCFFLILKEAF